MRKIEKADKLKLRRDGGEYFGNKTYFSYDMYTHEEDVIKLKEIIEKYGYEIEEQSMNPSLEDWEVITNVPYSELWDNN